MGGIPELKSAIKGRYEKVFGLEMDGLEPMATVGAKSALFEIAQLLYEEGDQVVLPRPYWVSYPAQVKLAGAEPVFVSGKPENHYLPTAGEIEEEVGSHTVGVVINSPANPSGGVYDRSQGRELVELARAHDLFLISDECYDGFVYERDKFWSLASTGYEKGLIVGSTSKNFAMTGWRLGYILGPPRYIRELEKIQSHLTSSPPSVSQKAGEVAFRSQLSLSNKLRKEFERKRDLLVDGLSGLPGVKCPPPPGSFYVFPEVKELLTIFGYGEEEDQELARILLEEAGVVTVPGSAFGAPGHLRMAYLTETDRLGEAVERIHSVVETAK